MLEVPLADLYPYLIIAAIGNISGLEAAVVPPSLCKSQEAVLVFSAFRGTVLSIQLEKEQLPWKQIASIPLTTSLQNQ